MSFEKIKNYINEHQGEFIEDLKAFLRIASVSADSAYKEEVRKAANFLRDYAQKQGATNVEIWSPEENGHPTVFIEFLEGEKLPTILVYGHYDVQPPDPLDLWDSPPFEPVIKDGKLYARGAADDKGQVFMYFNAIKTLKALDGKLPCNLKFVLEGEEEVGSKNLPIFIAKYKEKLRSDVILVSDTSMISLDVPSLTVSLRGIAAFEIRLQGPDRDLHSGVYGGAVANPANVLANLLAKLKDNNNKILIPGFYDDVREISETEKKNIAQIPFDEEKYAAEIGAPQLAYEEGFSPLEVMGLRPSLDVNGLLSGYTGEGGKTIIPSKAMAKISMRLVAHQNPEDIMQKTLNYIRELTPPSVKLEILARDAGAPPFFTDTTRKEYQIAEKAIEIVLGKKPVRTYEGGSIPILSLMQKELNTNVILLGFGLNSDSIHSPNEHFHIANYLKGTETIGVYMKLFSEEFLQ